MPPRMKDRKILSPSEHERRKASTIATFSAVMALCDFSMLLLCAVTLYAARQDASLDSSAQATLGTLRYLMLLFTLLFIASVGLWVMVRNRGRNARPYAILSAILHLPILPIGTALSMGLLCNLPPRTWLWQHPQST